mgnify:CR=1 FL=1
MNVKKEPWKDKNANKRKYSIAKLKDQFILEEIVLTDPNPGVRLAAISKIRDELFIRDYLLKLDKDLFNKTIDGRLIQHGKAICSRIDSEDLLIILLKYLHNNSMALICLRKLSRENYSNQEELVAIAKMSPSDVAGDWALSKIKDTEILAQLVHRIKDTYILRDVIKHITDFDTLANLAENHTDKYARTAAVVELGRLHKQKSQAIFEQIALNDDYYVGARSVVRIVDEERMLRIFEKSEENHVHKSITEEAILFLSRHYPKPNGFTRKQQELLKRKAYEISGNRVNMTVINIFGELYLDTSQAYFKSFINGDYSSMVKGYATQYITDKEVLEQLALNKVLPYEEREEAIERLGKLFLSESQNIFKSLIEDKEDNDWVKASAVKFISDTEFIENHVFINNEYKEYLFAELPYADDKIVGSLRNLTYKFRKSEDRIEAAERLSILLKENRQAGKLLWHYVAKKAEGYYEFPPYPF